MFPAARYLMHRSGRDLQSPLPDPGCCSSAAPRAVEVKMIAHCMKKVKWEKIKDQTYWGHESVENEGFAEVLKCLR